MTHFEAQARYLTIAQAAITMRVSTMTVYRMIGSGDLASVRSALSYRIREVDVQRHIDGRSLRVG